MSLPPGILCSHHTEAPCRRKATGRLLDSDGKRVPGAWMCDEHAAEVLSEYLEKAGWRWSFEPFMEASP